MTADDFLRNYAPGLPAGSGTGTSTALLPPEGFQPAPRNARPPLPINPEVVNVTGGQVTWEPANAVQPETATAPTADQFLAQYTPAPAAPAPEAPAPAPRDETAGDWQVPKAVARGAIAEGFYAGVEGASRLAAGVNRSLSALPLPVRIAGAALLPGAAASFVPGLDRAYEDYAESTADLRQATREALPVTEAFRNSIGGQIAEGIGQAIGTLPTYVIPGVGGSMAVGQMYDEGYQDALQKTGNAEIAHETALKYLPAAGLDILGDKLVIGRILKPLKGKVTVGELIKHIGASAVSEGVTEGAQQGWLNTVAKYLQGYDPERKLDDQVIRSAIVGAAVGGTVTAAGEGAARLAAKPSADDLLARYTRQPPPLPVTLGAEGRPMASDPLQVQAPAPPSAPAGTLAPPPAAPLPTPAPDLTPLTAEEKQVLARTHSFPRGRIDQVTRPEFETLQSLQPASRKHEGALQQIMRAADARYDAAQAAAAPAPAAPLAPEPPALESAEPDPFSLAPQPAPATPLAPGQVGTYLAQSYGLAPGGAVTVISDPAASYDGRAIFRDGKLAGIEINAAHLQSAGDIDRVLQHELAHGASEGGTLRAALDTLTPAERTAILAEMEALGYQRGDQAELDARGTDALVEAWQSRSWFHRIAGEIQRLAGTLGFRLTRLAAEATAARAMAQTLAATRGATAPASGPATDRLSRTPEALGRYWQQIARNPETQIGGDFSASTDLRTLLADFAGPRAAAIRTREIPDAQGRPWATLFIDSAGGQTYLDQTGSLVHLNSYDTQADGTAIYQAAYAWAHNTGRTVIGDPAGVSPIASLRRLSHMLSSALRFGTTRHVLPDSTQIEAMAEPGRLATVRTLLDERSFGTESEQQQIDVLLRRLAGWRLDPALAATAHNIGLLARAESRMVIDRLPGLEAYSFRDGQFYRDDQAIPDIERDRTLATALAALDSDAAQRTGPRTLARALVTAAAERSRDRAGRDVLRASAASPALERIRYSAAPSQGEAEAAGRDPGKRRKFMESVKAAPGVAPIAAQLEAIYEPITNKATVAQAQARINEIGLDRALAEVLATGVNNAPTALTNTMGIELMSRLQAVQRYDEAVSLAQHLAEQATSQGQAIQALSLLAKLTPAGINIYAQRLIAKAGDANPEMAALHAEIARLRQELSHARVLHGTQAILDIAEAIRSATNLTPEQQSALLVKLRDALLTSIGDSNVAQARLVQILLNVGIDRQTATAMAKKAIASFHRARRGALEKLLRQMLAQAVQGGAKARVPRSLFEQWLALNREGLLDDETVFTGIAKRYGLPVFTREHARRIQQLQAEYEKAPAGDLKLVAAARMMQAVHEIVPVDFWTKVRAVRNMVMLLNPKTIIRNVGGNVALWLAEVPADTLAWAADRMTSVVTGARTRTGLQMAQRLGGLAAPIRDYRAGANYARDQGRAHGLWKAGIDHMLHMARLTSGGVFHETRLNANYRSVFSSRVMRGLEATLSLALGAGDRAFHQSAFLASLARQRAAAGSPMLADAPEMIAAAVLDANAAIFQDDNVVSRALVAMQRTLNLNAWGRDERKFGLGNVILPFTQVPGSIAYRAAAVWSPIGLIRGLYAGRNLIFNRGQFDQRAFTDLLSRGLLGTGLGYLGYYLFKLGILSALPEDDPDREAMRKAAGLGQYRINASELYRRLLSGDWSTPAGQMAAAQDGDVVINYDWLQPLAVPVAAGGQLAAQEQGNARALARGKTVAALTLPMQAIASGMQTLEAQPLVSSFTSFMRTAGQDATAANPVGGLAGALLKASTEELAGGFVPTAMRQITQLGDNTLRETRATPMLGIGAGVPTLSDNFPPRYDVLGEMQQRYQSGTNTLFNVLLNPAFVTRVKADPVLKELDALYDRTGDPAALLNQTGRSLNINGQQIQLTNEQRSQYQAFIGRGSSQILHQLVASPGFARLPDEIKVKMVGTVIRHVGTAGKAQLFGHRPSQ